MPIYFYVNSLVLRCFHNLYHDMDAVKRKIRKHFNMDLVFKDSKILFLIIRWMALTAEWAEVDYSDFCR